VRIIANSYGCSTANVNACYSKQFEKAIAAFKAQGGLFIASAGNSGTNNDKVRRDAAPCICESTFVKHSTFWSGCDACLCWVNASVQAMVR
jgi:Subtilase family